MKKYLKIFEEFRDMVQKISYVRAKVDELQELALDIIEQEDDGKSKLNYSIQKMPEGYVLELDLLYQGELLDVNFELETLNLGIYSNKKHFDWTGKVTSIEEGMEKIEKALYSQLNVSEHKETGDSITEQIINDLLRDEAK